MYKLKSLHLRSYSVGSLVLRASSSSSSSSSIHTDNTKAMNKHREDEKEEQEEKEKKFCVLWFQSWYLFNW